MITKKKIFASAAIILSIMIILCFLPIRWNISQAVTVRMIEDMSEGYAEETEMLINGEYCFYLFRPDRFEGKIEIANFPETLNKDVEFIVAEKLPSHLIYRSWNGSKLNSESFGLIKADFGMKRMIIFKSNENGIINLDGEQTCVILSGASTLEDAYALLENVRNIN